MFQPPQRNGISGAEKRLTGPTDWCKCAAQDRNLQKEGKVIEAGKTNAINHPPNHKKILKGGLYHHSQMGGLTLLYPYYHILSLCQFQLIYESRGFAILERSWSSLAFGSTLGTKICGPCPFGPRNTWNMLETLWTPQSSMALKSLTLPCCPLGGFPTTDDQPKPRKNWLWK